MSNFTPSTILTADALNAAFAEKADVSAVSAKADLTSVYTKAQTDGFLNNKYNKSETYSSAEADAKIDEKIQALDVADTEIDGQYVSSVSQEDGKITVTKKAFPVTTIKNGDSVIAAEADGTVKLPQLLAKISLGNGYAIDDRTINAAGTLLIPMASAGNPGVTTFIGVKKTATDAAPSAIDATGHVVLPAASAGAYGLTNIEKVQLGGDDTTAVTDLDVASNGALVIPMAKAGNVGVTKVGAVYFPKGKEDSEGWDEAVYADNGVQMRRAKYNQYGVATAIDAEHALVDGAVKDLADMSNDALMTERAVGRYIEHRLGGLAGAMILKGQVTSNSDPILSNAGRESGWEVIAAGDFELIQEYGTIQVQTGDTLICMEDKAWHVFRPNVAVDDAMSDTSVNPVQNKVVKQYIEENGAKIKLEGESAELAAVSGVVTLPKAGTAAHPAGITKVANVALPGDTPTAVTIDADGNAIIPIVKGAIPGLVYQMLAETVHEPTGDDDTQPIIPEAFKEENTTGTGKTFVPTVAAIEKLIKIMLKKTITNVFAYDADTDTLTCDLTKLD